MPRRNDLRMKSVLWLGGATLDADWANRFEEAGIDEIVVDLGTISLGGRAPVVRLRARPVLPRVPRSAVLLHVRDPRSEQLPESAPAVWQALRSSLADTIDPVEVLLDLPEVPEGLDAFVSALATAAARPVVPVLTVDQIATDPVRRVVQAAGGAVVLAFGSLGALRPGVRPSNLPLAEQLAPLAGLGIRPRVGVVVRPTSVPPLAGWGQDLDRLTENSVAEVSTSSKLDRTFRFRSRVSWSGREWAAGQSVAVGWTDAARLDAALREVCNLPVPEPGGWDLVSLPPGGEALGMGREALLAYLEGRGPGPGPRAVVDRSRRNLRVGLDNPTRFAGAVSSYGTWLEASVEEGTLVVEDRGGFDRVLLGSRRSGRWKDVVSGPGDAVRFFETYLAPGEIVRPGRVRLPSSRSRAVVRWQVQLTTGKTLTGTGGAD